MNVNVILIDRDPVSIYLYQRALAKLDALKFPLFKFSSGREALKHLQHHRDDDRRYVILMDIHLGSMSGWEFLDLICRLYPEKVRVIIVGEANENEDISKTTRYEAVVSYFEKPISMESLHEIAQLVCQMVHMTTV